MCKSHTNFHPEWTTNMDYRQKFVFSPQIQHYSQCAEVHITHTHSIHFFGHILPKFDKKCTKYSNRLLTNAWLSGHIFKNQTAQQHYVEYFYTEFHPNWSRNIKSIGRKSFIALVNVQPSLSWVSQNSCCSTTFCK